MIIIEYGSCLIIEVIGARIQSSDFALSALLDMIIAGRIFVPCKSEKGYGNNTILKDRNNRTKLFGLSDNTAR